MAILVNPPASAGTARQQTIDARRTQYLEVRGAVHRKLLTKLNLEKLANCAASSEWFVSVSGTPEFIAADTTL